MNYVIVYSVLVPPINLQIQSTYHPGDKIQCSAEGNPEPSYQWTDLVSGTVIQGAVLVITEDMLNKSHTFRCTASNQYNNSSSTVHFTVEGINTTIALHKFSIAMIKPIQY